MILSHFFGVSFVCFQCVAGKKKWDRVPLPFVNAGRFAIWDRPLLGINRASEVSGGVEFL